LLLLRLRLLLLLLLLSRLFADKTMMVTKGIMCTAAVQTAAVAAAAAAAACTVLSADKTMMVTKGITCNNCDMGSCSGSTCTGGAFFRVDETYREACWLFNW
jgi:hypothetical protein